MADSVNQSLADYIKTKGIGKRGNRRGGQGPSRGGGGGNASGGNSFGNRNRGNRNAFRGRRGGGGRQSNNGQQQQGRNNGGFGNRRRNANVAGAGYGSNQRRGNVQRFVGGGGGGGGQQLQNRRQRNRNRNRNVNRQFSGGGGGGNQGVPNRQRYFNNNALATVGARGRRNQGQQRPRQRQRQRIPALTRNLPVVGGLVNPRAVTAATKRAYLKLAKKRVQRAKLLVSKRKIVGGVGKTRKMITNNSNVRVALGKNGFFTVRNTKAKQVERSLVKLKIARAQKARTRISPQQQRNTNMPMPGPSRMGNRSIRAAASARPRPPPLEIDWNPPIVRTMRNDLVDEMSTSQLNPEIQRKIAFIQSRSRGDRTPVMQDFKAPVTTSRMKLSDRFRLLGDQ